MLWARPCGGLEPLDLCRPDPPNPSPPQIPASSSCSSSSCTFPIKVGAVGRGSPFFYMSLLFVVVCLVVLWRCARVLLETLETSVSHSCAWTWIPMIIDCACGGSDLHVNFLVGFLGMILAELSRPWFPCGSCQLCLLILG